VRDNLFVELECENGTTVTGYLNIQTCQWHILDFSLKLPIRSIDGYDQGNLIVRTESTHYTEDSFYKIPFG
jgi:hypothetical protein